MLLNIAQISRIYHLPLQLWTRHSVNAKRAPRKQTALSEGSPADDMYGHSRGRSKRAFNN